MMNLTIMRNKLAEAISERQDKIDELQGLYKLQSNIKEGLSNMNELLGDYETIVTYESNDGGLVKLNLTKERIACAEHFKNLLNNYYSQVNYVESCIDELNNEIHSLESMIQNHWSNKLRRQLCYLGFNVKIGTNSF